MSLSMFREAAIYASLEKRLANDFFSSRCPQTNKFYLRPGRQPFCLQKPLLLRRSKKFVSEQGPDAIINKQDKSVAPVSSFACRLDFPLSERETPSPCLQTARRDFREDWRAETVHCALLPASFGNRNVAAEPEINHGKRAVRAI
jgi:hypothetical protein